MKISLISVDGPPINVVPVSIAANEADPEGNETLAPCTVSAVVREEEEKSDQLPENTNGSQNQKHDVTDRLRSGSNMIPVLEVMIDIRFHRYKDSHCQDIGKRKISEMRKITCYKGNKNCITWLRPM